MTQSKYPYHYLWYTLPSYCDDWHFLNNIKRLATSGKGDIICIDIGKKKRKRKNIIYWGVCVGGCECVAIVDVFKCVLGVSKTVLYSL